MSDTPESPRPVGERKLVKTCQYFCRQEGDPAEKGVFVRTEGEGDNRKTVYFCGVGCANCTMPYVFGMIERLSSGQARISERVSGVEAETAKY